ncbi:Dynein heavy chain AAA lid domain containing protein [Plasmodiophora brassicae]
MSDPNGEDPPPESLESLRTQHYRNVLQSVYANAAAGEDTVPARPQGEKFQSHEPDPADAAPESASWRARVANEMKMMSQPGQSFRKRKKPQSKDVEPVRRLLMPKFPFSKHDTLRNGPRAHIEVDMDRSAPATISERIGAHYSLGVAALDRELLGEFRQVLHKGTEYKLKATNPAASKRGAASTSKSNVVDRGRDALSVANYNLPDESERLYREYRDPVDKLSLELFDADEFETHSGEEWVAMPPPVMGRALWCVNHQWVWLECKVLSFDSETKLFTIEFTDCQNSAGGPFRKKVRRLSLCFDAEDQARFFQRRQVCEMLREQARALHRYRLLINAQPSSAFATARRDCLQRIVQRLVQNGLNDLVVKKQSSVEKLLSEVRDEFMFSQKQSLIHYNLLNPEEALKILSLNLPEFPERTRRRFFGTLDVNRGPRLYWNPVTEHLANDPTFNQLRAQVEYDHFTLQPEVAEVLQTMFTTWEALSSKRFLFPIPANELPVSAYTYQDMQENNYNELQYQLINDWREPLIHNIRDSLANVFDLFIRSPEQYVDSELQRFLQKTTLLMRTNLAKLILTNLHEWGLYLDSYTLSLHDAMPEAFACDSTSMGDDDAPDGVMVDDNQGSTDESMRCPLSALRFVTWMTPVSRATSLPPLFLFRLTSMERRVVFLPGLESICSVLTSLLDLPIKAQAIAQMDNEIVPLLGLDSRALCSPDTTPDIFAEAERQKSILSNVVDAHLQGPLEIFRKYEAFQYLLELDVDNAVKAWFAGVPEGSGQADDGDPDDKHQRGVENRPLRKRTCQETRDEIARYLQAEADINATSLNQITFPMITVQCEMIKNQLISKAQDMSKSLINGFLSEVRTLTENLNDSFSGKLARLKAPSKDVSDLAELKDFVKRIEKTEIVQMLQDIDMIRRHIAVLDEFNTALPQYDFELFWKIVAWPREIKSAIHESKVAIQEDNRKFKEELLAEQEKFVSSLALYKAEVKGLYQYGPCPPDKMEERASQVDVLQDKLDKADKLVVSFNDRERLFELEPTEYAELEEIKAEFEPVLKLWSISSLFHTSHTIWMTGSFIELDPAKMEADASSWWKDMFRLEKVFSERDAKEPAKVATSTKNSVADFRLHLPIISNLRNPGLRPRHWTQISDLLGQTVVPDQNLTWNQLLSLDVHSHKDRLEEVCVYADKEYALEQALDKMEDEWKAVNLKIVPHKNSGTFKIVDIDEALTTLDDHIVKTQTMRGSPYIKAFDARVKKWESRLVLVSKVVEEWLACQKTWLYLDPIFSSDDIMRQMPVEARRFQMVDQYWRKTMAAAHVRPNLLEFVSEVDNLHKGFLESNKILDLIQKGLNEYLEVKRLAFPRFFFLSNDELLEILSQTKDPNAVQPHLPKCFENISSLDFNEDMDIIAMHSAEQEEVQFIRTVNPTKGPNKGKVELWLGEVEALMRDSLSTIMMKSLKAHHDPQAFVREKWLLSWPGQIVLAVSQIVWTSEVEDAIRKGGTRGLKKYIGKLNSQLDAVVELVRGPLSELNRMTLGALIVIDVHARDSIQKMIEQGCDDVDSFTWLGQLRYYVEENSLQVRMINASIEYAYEYLGNSPRLVITPLTDRCYRTLMGALHLNLGGAPEGPAGTGKTETVKDLAKAVAKQCVVFNCSDSLDYLVMAKFFKGLVASGAWACFDEFNRIDLEVLSVVAQQMQSIQRAVNEGKTRFIFEGSELPLNRSCAIFITMNPGYAGRSELPDNLKTLFRTVAMMVPDYSLIAEIVLYSCGYSTARPLARKIVTGLRLASEQLSSQDHYDFGMRTVKSILTAAGALKRDHPHTEEDQLCLRAINDCNMPKFTADDAALFAGITRDLFPSVNLHAIQYEELDAGIAQESSRLNLEVTHAFRTHCLNLYETVRVRHGLMIVGRTLAGKTSAIRVLAGAMKNVNVYTINPKSLSMGKLYGEFDPSTREWKNGIITVIVRECASSTSPNRKWVVFDGPVDALWIENMNTVLDDNKKLCLASGEIIKLSKTMTMMFEVEDLSAASPATVSRCGMVYMEPDQVGVHPLVQCWLRTLCADLKPIKDDIDGMFNWLVLPSLDFCSKRTQSTLPFSVLTSVRSLLSMFDALVKTQLLENPDSSRTEQQLAVIVECLFAFALIWTIGANTNAEGRSSFDKFVRMLFDGKALKESTPGLEKAFEGISLRAPMPARGSVYDYVYQVSTRSWRQWLDNSQAMSIPANAAFQDIIVPTLDSVRNSWLLATLVKANSHVLWVGGTGTGKTLCISETLTKTLANGVFSPVSITFSAKSSASQTQDIIDSKCDRRRKGVFGPPLGKRYVVFVDDLSMPAKEQYGAQPPIELLRQWMDHNGWYTDNEFRTLVDIQFVSAMGSPGGGRNEVTSRFLRHFVALSVIPFDSDSMQRIFSTILKWWIDSFPNPSDLLSVYDKLVSATVKIYDTIAKELRPTPAKSHYTFNLRDLSKVFQGILSGKKAAITSPIELVRLWAHECTRVFCDRLVDGRDENWFMSLLAEQVKSSLGMNYSQDVLAGDPNRRLIYCNFLASDGAYSEVTNNQNLRRRVNELLEDYNIAHTTTMNLVLFESAIEHITRIVRIIRNPLGNALLVGVGGSGRQSLTRIAAFAAEYQVFSIEAGNLYGVNEWRDDLKKLLTTSGVEDVQQVFLLSDNNLKNESFLEDINNILNNGEVPNLFAPEELASIVDSTSTAARAANRGDSASAVYSFFVQRCRQNIHIVLCLSPIGDAFRERLRQFPSLVNCCTIDWFHPWPTNALRSVADRFLANVDVDERVVDICVSMQQSVVDLSAEYKAALNRYNYVTPTSYLSLLKTFSNIFESKRSEIGRARDRYVNGLQKLADTEIQVKGMQEQLELLKPQLIQSSAETADLMVTIQLRTAEADAQSKVVETETQICNQQAAEAQRIKDECQVKLDAALPAYENALKALKVLKKSDIVEVKAMKTPPPAVVLTMETICIMLDVEPIKVGAAGQKVSDYWETAKKSFLGDPKFLTTLQNYDKDNIPPKIIDAIRPYMDNPEFIPDKVKKASVAAQGLCKWVRALFTYNEVAKDVGPMKIALANSEASLAEAKKQLDAKIVQFDAVQQLLKDLKTQFEIADAKKRKLEDDVEDCSRRLERAEKLIGGLGGEKDRWTQRAADLTKDFNNVVGNIVVSSGVIAYLGTFTHTFREKIIAAWKAALQAASIPVSEAFTLNSVLGNPVEIREWIIQKLPKDQFSLDNAVIMKNSTMYPLMIDPQAQAHRWICLKEKSRSMKIVKLRDSGFTRTLENCLQFGTPLLIEDVGETLDSMLDPILTKQFYVAGGRKMIKLGEASVEFDTNFSLYMTTKLANPHYTPQISTKVVIVNFMITPEGLEDQMLGQVVSKEEPKLEQERNELIVSNSEYQRQLSKIEDEILQRLSSAEGNILDNEELIAALGKSKEASKQIEKRVQEAITTETRINKIRAEYQPLALTSSNLFFCISDLVNVDPMYQYSLEWFVGLFLRSIDSSPKAPQRAQRTTNIRDQFTYNLYKNVCRSLFEDDKLLFSFLLCVKHLEGKGELNQMALRFLLTGVGNGAPYEPIVNPSPDWLTGPIWPMIQTLSQIEDYNGLDASFQRSLRHWKRVYESPDPYNEAFPEPFQAQMDPFQRLLVVRCLRFDKLVPGIQSFVSTCMGKKFIEPPPFDLNEGFEDSSNVSPLVFVLSPGADPVAELYKFADTRGYATPDKLASISLGQGQGAIAEAAIAAAIDKGTWVLLQNCHLAVSWMSSLEKIVQDINPETAHPDFRLWLTSNPSKQFPVSILQNGVKMTNEPPRGVRANMLRSFSGFDPQWYQDCPKPKPFKRLLFGLCFFHAIVQERRKFGPLGWNIMYEFNASDLSISVRQLRQFIETYETVPLQALRYLTGELNYGGRVTDENDRRTMNHILKTFYCDQIVSVNPYALSSSGVYKTPPDGALDSVIAHIKKFPTNDEPSTFGLHDNASISSAIKESSELLDAALCQMPRSTNTSGAVRDLAISRAVADTQAAVPALFDIEAISAKYTVEYKQSLNTVLVQEIKRFNRLLNKVKSTLSSLSQALAGQLVMTSELETLGNDIFDGRVPRLWASVSYPSLKPLSSWADDLSRRIAFLRDWVDNGPPHIFWISGFFFTQSFLTGALQNYARAHQFPIDTLSFDFEVMSSLTGNEDRQAVKAPESGCYVSGMFLEGARWDSQHQCLGISMYGQGVGLGMTIACSGVHAEDIADANACRLAEADEDGGHPSEQDTVPVPSLQNKQTRRHSFHNRAFYKLRHDREPAIPAPRRALGQTWCCSYSPAR